MAFFYGLMLLEVKNTIKGLLTGVPYLANFKSKTKNKVYEESISLALVLDFN